MLTFMNKVHIGIKGWTYTKFIKTATQTTTCHFNICFTGLIYGENDKPISGALVDVIGIYHPVKTTERGEFWRLLLPGNYSISVKAPK